MKHNNKQGIVLIVVLWVLFFLSVVTLTLGFRNRLSIRLRDLNNEESRMFYLAKEGINRVILRLAEDDISYDAFSDIWSKDFSLQSSEGLLSCEVIDEDRFLNINTISSEIFKNLAVLFPELTTEHIEAINKARPFNVVEELLAFADLNTQDFYGDKSLGKIGMKDLLTVFSDGRFNINTVPRQILLLIPEMTEATAEVIIEHRKTAPFQEDKILSEELSLLGLTAAQVSSLIKFTKVSSSVFRIKANASSRRKHISKELEMVVSRKNGKFNILYVKES